VLFAPLLDIFWTL